MHIEAFARIWSPNGIRLDLHAVFRCSKIWLLGGTPGPTIDCRVHFVHEFREAFVFKLYRVGLTCDAHIVESCMLCTHPGVPLPGPIACHSGRQTHAPALEHFSALES